MEKLLCVRVSLWHKVTQLEMTLSQRQIWDIKVIVKGKGFSLKQIWEKNGN